jgi:Sulfotransferase family
MENSIAHQLEVTEATGRDELLAAIAAYARAVLLEAKREPAIAPPPNVLVDVLRWLEFPVFICGHHRSGTTLLQQLLDGHPQLVVVPGEGTLFSSFKYLARSSPTKADIERFALSWVERFVDPNLEPHFKLGRTGSTNPSVEFVRRLLMWDRLLRASRPDWRRVVPLLALAAAYQNRVVEHDQIRGWTDKTPLNENHVKRLTVFKQGRFIHMIRHPSDTLASLRHAWHGARFDAAMHSAAIGRSFKLASRNQRQYHGRYLVVRYEDLVEDTAATMECVRQFLSLSQSSTLATPTSTGFAVRSNSSFERSDPGVIRRSHQGLTVPKSDSVALAALTGSAARGFGYPSPSVALATGILYRLRGSFGRIARRLGSRFAPVMRRGRLRRRAPD